MNHTIEKAVNRHQQVESMAQIGSWEWDIA